MSETKSGYIAFRPRARLLKLIGAELISDEVVAVTELVKNAHDADASAVVITFRNVTGDDGEIHIVDDGCGMDRETFLGGWMEPAGSMKAGADGHITPRGRRVLGEKGVGRFAADKLGRELELVSRREGHDAEVRAVFDWDQFDNEGQMLSEIKNRWELRPAKEIDRQGTILRIRRLRERWTERMFRRLSTRLGRLQSPFGNRHGFTIRIDSDDFPEYSGELKGSFLDRAPYAIDLAYDGEDSFRVQLGGKRRTTSASQSAGALACGSVRVRLSAFDLETEALARIGPRLEVRAWLREWSGVSVYRDGFRIWPYGEPHDDWLRLDQRRVNNPVVRLSNNQVVGFVEISRDGNSDLLDQTNREGLIHNGALDDLRKIIEQAFVLLEEERQRIRHPASAVRSARRRKSIVELPAADLLDRIAGITDRKTRNTLKRAASEARETLQRQHDLSRLVIEGYTDLAATGQAASELAGPLAGIIERMGREIASLTRSAGTGTSHEAAERLRSSQRQVLEVLQVLGKTTGIQKLRGRNVEVLEEIAAFRAAIEPIIQVRGVQFRATSEGTKMLRADMHPQTFRRLLYLLVSNSLDWLLRTDEPRISVHSRAAGDWCEVVFSDNGPGISLANARRVFEPMFSTKEGGRGMGLTIARGLVEQRGGTIDVVIDGRRKGAWFCIRLPRKRSRATVTP